MKQFLHGLFIAVGTAVLPALITAFQNGEIPTVKQLETFGLIGLGAGFSYVLKNYILGSGLDLSK